jgi:hypothetical protein
MLNNYHLFGESQDLIGKYEKVMMSYRAKREGDHKGHSEMVEEISSRRRFSAVFITLRPLERLIPCTENYELQIP